MIYFGGRLRELRKSKSLTQKQLAEILGITKASISAYETSAKHPSVEVLIAICVFFQVPSDHMLGLSDVENFELYYLTDEQTSLIDELKRQFDKANRGS